MKIGKAIKIARIKRGLQQKQLAKALDVSPNYISMLENDKRDPSWSFVCKAAQKLETPLPLLLLLASDGEDDPVLGLGLKSKIAGHLLGILLGEEADLGHGK